MENEYLQKELAGEKLARERLGNLPSHDTT